MICFELSRNGKRLATAGLPGFAVLSASVTWVRRRSRRRGGAPEEELKVDLGGLDSNDPSSGYHHRWIEDDDVKVGDVFKLRVLESERPDAPARRSPREDGKATSRNRIASLERNIAAYQRALKALRLELRKAKGKSRPQPRRRASDR